MIKGLIFDYGGTLDSGGNHWSEVIYSAWKKAGLNVDKSLFRDAYVYAERELAKTRHILPEHSFLDLLEIKMEIELKWLLEHLPEGEKAGLSVSNLIKKSKEIARICDSEARGWIEKARPVLESLKQEYPMVLVSNFYGNVERVLEVYDLRKYFSEIVESAVVGVRKPDPKIFTLGVEALQRIDPEIKAEDIVVIGDSLKKDILPAERAGCRAIWIKGKGWTDEEDEATYPQTIKSISDLPTTLINLN